MQKRTGGIIVGMPNHYYVLSTFNLNAENTWLAFSFCIDGTSNKTISKVKVVTSAITIPQANISVSAELYSANPTTWKPNAALDGPQTLTNIAAGVWEFTGFDYASIAPGTLYFIVFKNTAANPATDYPTFRYSNNQVIPLIHGAYASLGFNKWSSTDGGSTWGSSSVGSVFMRIEFSDGTFIGYPFSNYGYASKCFGNNWSGVRFTTPSNATLNVAGIVAMLYAVNGPTGDMMMTLKHSGQSVDTVAYSVDARQTAPMYFYFETVQSIPPDTEVTVWFSVGNGSSSNYIAICEYIVMDDADSKGMLPFANGTTRFWQKVTSTDAGVNATLTDTAAPMMGLILSSDGEFAQPNQGRRYRR